jgi:hypothetical protein
MKQAVSAFVELLDSSLSSDQVRSEIASFVVQSSLPQNAFLEDVAAEIAYRFVKGELDYMNASTKTATLYSAILEHQEIPSLLSEVYWALDEGEYGVEDDDPNEEDAAANRSRVQVEQVLVRNRGQ